MTTRVALCITDLDVGGAELCLAELAARLDRTRFAPAVYCLGPEPAGDPAASCIPRLADAGVEFHCLGGRGWGSLPRVLRNLTGLLKRQRPEVMQTFLFHANILGRLAARRAGVPKVFSGIRVAEPRRWHQWCDRLTAGLVDRHVCVSRAVADFSARAGLPADRLVVIPNGVDTAKYPAVPAADLALLGIPSWAKVVAAIGRLEPQKGLDWLLRAAPSWLGRLSDGHVLVVGKGSERPRLERLRDELGLASRVHFTGWRADVANLLAACHLLVLPSRWEGMPNVVLQAMASGLPVVATHAEGVRELLGPHADEQVTPFGDSLGLADRITAILRDDTIATRLGEENRRRAASHFSLDAMVRAYEGLWLAEDG